ncbi:glycosyltransferase [uncultured Eubacterium sp.]|uniref:glycosyltransferase n=1 Tax=uncultured Eubacterium sp. TaxID=165185 RepID=UPI0026001008|nr:glycosyltransferase [uncultured Eubacterium sp.]
MKKILFLIHDLSYGGAEKVLVNLANNLDKTKYDVTIQTLFDVGVNKKFLSNDVHYIGGFKKMFPGNTKLMKLFSPNILCKLVIRKNYDVVVSFLEGPCCRIASAYNGKKIAWIHIEHKTVEELSASFRSQEEMTKCYNSFDKIICVADTVKENFCSLFDVKADCKVLYNVNETNQIIEKSKESQDIISHCDGCFNIVSVGRLSFEHKGYDRLVRIHKRLLDNGINSKLYILGEGGDRNKLELMIKDLNICDSCLLLGFDENPYKYVAAADLFVCSSLHEGFSTAVTESLVIGTPVISTKVSGANELLGCNNEYGIVTENNENALYDGIYTILTEEGLLDKYKKQAKIRGKKFSTNETVENVEKLLEDLILCSN